MKKEREEYLWWLDLGATMVVMAMLHRAAEESWNSMGFFGFGALFLWLVQRTGFFLLLLGGIFLSLFRRTGRRLSRPPPLFPPASAPGLSASAPQAASL